MWPVADRTSGPEDTKVRAIALPAKPMRVLAVDDDAPRLAELHTVAMLEDLGHTVVEAVSVAAALKMRPRSCQFDLVITDQAMPEMTGAQLMTAIRAGWPSIPIILATGYAEVLGEVAIAAT